MLTSPNQVRSSAGIGQMGGVATAIMLVRSARLSSSSESSCRHRCLRVPQPRPFAQEIRGKALHWSSLLVPQARPFREFAVVPPEHRHGLSAAAGYIRFLENSTRNAPLGIIARSAKRLTQEFARIARFLEKPTHKCSTRRRCSFRKSSVSQEPRHVPVLQLARNPHENAPFGIVVHSAKRSFRNKSITCSASFLVLQICLNSSFLTLARRRRWNCRFLEEIRVKRAPFGVVACSAGLSVPQICSFLCFPYFFVNLIRLCSSQRDVDKWAPISPAPTLTTRSSGATFDARVID